MRKIVVHRPGGHDRLVVEEGPDPAPGPGEVAVDVAACGVNYADVMVRMGLYASAKRYVGWPITPGFEMAGTVAAVGEGVGDLRVGDRVIAVTRFGGYASRVVVQRWAVVAAPEGMPLHVAASLPTAWLTAWYAVHELAHPRPGQRALVHSAAGGVGGALVQLLQRAGCEVVGVVGSSHKVALVEELGARVVDKSREPLWPAAERLAPDGYHHVFDANGVETLRGSFEHLAAPGKLVVYGFHSMLDRGRERPPWWKLPVRWLRTPRFSPLAMTGANRSVLAFNLSYLFEERALFAEAMGALLAGFADGGLRPLPVTRFPLDRVADAHGALESGSTIGKLVLEP